MASEAARAAARQHAAACNTLAAYAQNQEIETLAAALSDANKWLDASFEDMQNTMRRLAVVESSLTEANEEIWRLKALLRM